MPSTPVPSPYLRDPHRLGDVIAAIQAMAIYKKHSQSFERWARRIEGDPARAEHWRGVFEEHPEFFRLNGARDEAALVWRRQYRRSFDVDLGRELTSEELKARRKNKGGLKHVKRRSLSPGDVSALITTAIQLHSRAVEYRQERRWWLQAVLVVATAGAGLLGAILGALIKSGH